MNKELFSITKAILIYLLSLVAISCGGNGENRAELTAVRAINMLGEANAELKRIDSNAFLVYASGQDRAGGLLTDPANTSLWTFIGISLKAGIARGETRTEAVHQLRFESGKWTAELLPQPPFGIEFRDLTEVSMDVDLAYQKVVQAGLGAPFGIWELFKPLHASVEHTVYVFTDQSGRHLVVDTVTGEVSVE